MEPLAWVNLPSARFVYIVFWCYFVVGCFSWWVDGWKGWWMYGCDRMHGWLGVCVDGVWIHWRGLIARELGLSVLLWCYCFVVGWVNGGLMGRLVRVWMEGLVDVWM